MDQPKNGIPELVEKWCVKHGYTEPFCHEGQWWAFPPHGVNPVPLPVTTLPARSYATRESLSLASVQRRLLSYFLASILCPMFAFLLYRALNLPPEFFIGFIGFAVAFFIYLTIRGLWLLVEYLLR